MSEDLTAVEIGDRLRIARESAKVTQAAAAEALQVARTTVIAIEQGQRKPRLDELQKFAALYALSVNSLLRREAVQIDLKPRFRRTGEADADVEAAVALLTTLVQAELELEDLLGVRRVRNDPPERPLLPGNVAVQAEQDAAELRQWLGIGMAPVHNIRSVLELQLGARVFVRRLPAKISGLYAFDERAGACILLNAAHPKDRRAQTGAHELGHFTSTRRRRYRADLAAEIERMGRVADASELLADLKVTHCPACDQGIIPYQKPDHCFVCHQHLPEEPTIAGLGEVRLQFEQDRLNAELLEAGELIAILERDVDKQTEASRDADEALQTIEVELAPARRAVAAVAQADVSAIDVALGKAAERQRQMDRVAAALELGKSLTEQVQALEDEIKPLQEKVDEANRSIDFNAAAQTLEDGMNAYLAALNVQRPDTWKHNVVEVDISKSSTSFRVGRKRWQGALGGTDSLYFLMAYQYGLLSLSPVAGMHYPGLSIIDVPGEFSGEEVKDSENFIVQPFINLLAQAAFEGAQLIITGASFAGLQGVHTQKQTHVHVA